MTFPVRETLQVLLAACVVLAAVILGRDLIARGRKPNTAEQPRFNKENPKEDPAATPSLSALENELE